MSEEHRMRPSERFVATMFRILSVSILGRPIMSGRRRLPEIGTRGTSDGYTSEAGSERRLKWGQPSDRCSGSHLKEMGLRKGPEGWMPAIPDSLSCDYYWRSVTVPATLQFWVYNLPHIL